MTMQTTVLKLDPKDNVLIALRGLHKGDAIAYDGHTLTLATDVPAKHKFATREVPVGGTVVMYGVVVCKAREAISAGEIITTRNTGHEAEPYHESSAKYSWIPPRIE